LKRAYLTTVIDGVLYRLRGRVCVINRRETRFNRHA